MTKHRDPQWLPSDADLINWVEKGGYHVSPSTYDAPELGWWVTKQRQLAKCERSGMTPVMVDELGRGPTWRAAVEDAMHNEEAE